MIKIVPDENFHKNEVIVLAYRAPAPSGILKLAKAAHLHINRGRNWAIVREAAEVLTQEEINILEGVEL